MSGIVENAENAQPSRSSYRDKAVQARMEHRSNCSKFTTELTGYLQQEYHCSNDDVVQLLLTTTILVRAISISMRLNFKPQRQDYLVLEFIAFKNSYVDTAAALFDFIIGIVGNYGVENIYVICPTGLSDSFFKSHDFKDWKNGNGWYVSIKNDSESSNMLKNDNINYQASSTLSKVEVEIDKSACATIMQKYSLSSQSDAINYALSVVLSRSVDDKDGQRFLGSDDRKD